MRCRTVFQGWCLGLVVAAAWLMVVGHARLSSAARPPLARDVRLAYLARLPQPPAQARQVRVWIPLAKTTPRQVLLERRIDSPVPYTITEDPLYGNEMMHLEVTAPLPQLFEVTVEYRVRLLGADQLMPEPAPTEAQLVGALEARGLLSIDDDVRARAAEATAGKHGHLQQARGIYAYVIRHMRYDKQVPGWGRGDTRRACRLGVGNCTDFHSLFVSMARARGLPARFNMGVLVPPQASGVLPGYHCWAECYVPRRGWLQVDASEAWKHPQHSDAYFDRRQPDRFLISQGRDLLLMPPPHGGPVNFFFFPYVEADTVVVEGAEAEIRVLDFNPEESI